MPINEQTFLVTPAIFGGGPIHGYTKYGIPTGVVSPDPAYVTDDGGVNNREWYEISDRNASGGTEIWFEAGTPNGTFDADSIATLHLIRSGEPTQAFDFRLVGDGGDVLSRTLGSGSGWYWIPGIDGYWPPAQAGNEWTAVWNQGFGPSFDEVDIIREDFEQSSGVVGTTSVAINDWEVDELILVSVSAQDQHNRGFLISATDEDAQNWRPVGGQQKMPGEPWDSHQFFYLKVRTAGNKTITMETQRLRGDSRNTIPVGLRVWRLSGVATSQPVVNYRSTRGDTLLDRKGTGPIQSPAFVLDGDRRYGHSTGAITEAAIFAVMLNTTVADMPITGANFTAESVNRFGDPNSYVNVDVDTYLNSGAFSGFQLSWALSQDTVFVGQALQLRSSKTAEFARLRIQKYIGGGRAGVAVPQGVYSASHTVEITGGRSTNKS